MYFNDENNKTNIDREFDNSSKRSFNFSFNKKIGLIILLAVVVVLGIFFIARINKTEYYLVLDGLEDMTIYQNSVFVDPGYTAYDNKDNDYTSEVVVTGKVNENVAGEYVIQYQFNEMIKERVVTVIGEINQVTYLNLLGNQVIYLKVNEVYQEPGYIVLDSVDSNLQNKVNVVGKVDTGKAGTYKITYSVVNSANVTVTAERTVIVMDSNISVSYTPTEFTNKDVVIKINVQANYFDYVLLPDGTRSTQRYLEYKVDKNGEYKFQVFEKSGTVNEQKIVINNIDKEKPTLSCTGTVDVSNAIIKVSASDKESGVKSYKYYVNGVIVGENSKSNYTYSKTDGKTFKVGVTDDAGNYNEKNCQVVYVDPSVNNPNILYYTAFNSEYVIPKTTNSLKTFVNMVENKISQTALDTCHSSCLSVSLYHAYMIQYGNLREMNVQDACNWKYNSNLGAKYFNTSQEVLYTVFDEINAGRYLAIQVNGSSGRHFALAVGYRRKVYRKEDMTEADLLIIDSWDGKLETMDKSISPKGRYLWKRSYEGWRVDVFKKR